MEHVPEIAKKPKARLKFIDMARSFAILLMLEGHFTGAALSSEYRDYQYPLYKFWHMLHGLTSPLFFTVTGLIFVYLLMGQKDISFRDNIRVKKGYRRIAQLLFWGYLIQLNLWSIGKSIYYGSEFHMEWFYAFHVLQSIGIGLLLVIGIYRVYKWINIGQPLWYYLIAGITMFACYSLLKEHIMIDKKLVEEGIRQSHSYWPSKAPSIIQNMFYGPYSDFSFVRMSGYTILGGMIGCIVRAYQHKAKEWWFGTAFIISGLLMSIYIRDIFIMVDDLTEYVGLTSKGVYELNSTSLSRFGQVVVLLGVLMLIDAYFNIKAELFLKIGQTTFPIYVVHVIILYGGLFGFGLKPLVFSRDLDPWLAVTISASAIAVFAVMVKYIEPLTKIYDTALYAVRLKKRPVESD
jgi:hypothetical protein